MDFGVLSGQNIQVDPQVNAISIRTTDAISVMQFAVSGASMLGLNTTCMKPLQPSCYDISGQQCTTPLSNNCLPSIVTFDTVVTNNLILLNGSSVTTVSTLDNATSLYLDTLVSHHIILTEDMACTNSSLINQSCLNLGGYSCPFGEPLADSCFPANMTFYDLAVTHELDLNLVQCLGPPMPLSCFPLLTGDVTGTLNGTYLSAIQGVSVATTTPFAYDVLSVNPIGQWTNLPSNPLNVPNAFIRRDAFGNASMNVLTANSIQSIDPLMCLGMGRAQSTPSLAAITDTVYLFDRDSYYGINDTVYVFDLNTGQKVLPALGYYLSLNFYKYDASQNLWAISTGPSFGLYQVPTLVCTLTGMTYPILLGFASDTRAIVIDAFPYPLTKLYLIDTTTCAQTLITINVPAYSLSTAYKDTVYILSADTTTPTTNLWAIDNVLSLSGTQRFLGSTRIRSQVNTLYGPPDQFFPICYKGAMRLFVTGGSTQTFTALIDPVSMDVNVMPALGMNTDTLNYLGWFTLAPKNPFSCPLSPAPSMCLDGSVEANGHEIRNIGIAHVTEIRSASQTNVTIPNRLVLLDELTFANDTYLSRPQKRRLQTNGDFVARRHFLAEPFSGPTVSIGTGAGSGASVAVTANSNDCKMQITLNTGTGTLSSADLFTVTYGQPFEYNVTKGVVFSPANVNAVGAPVYIDTETLTSFIFRIASPSLTISSVFIWNIQACV
jgi:hypothetical protein